MRSMHLHSHYFHTHGPHLESITFVGKRYLKTISAPFGKWIIFLSQWHWIRIRKTCAWGKTGRVGMVWGTGHSSEEHTEGPNPWFLKEWLHRIHETSMEMGGGRNVSVFSFIFQMHRLKFYIFMLAHTHKNQILIQNIHKMTEGSVYWTPASATLRHTSSI